MNVIFPSQWIGHAGLVAWSPRSPDLNWFDFFLWDHMDNLVLAMAVDNDEDLHHRIMTAIKTTCDAPGMLERMRQSMAHCYKL